MGFFIIFNSNSGKDEPQTLHYAITQNCSMGADVRHLVAITNEILKTGVLCQPTPITQT